VRKTGQERRNYENDNKRGQLEADLQQSGWVECSLRWLERWDRMVEKRHRRILTDEQGCFVYKHTNGAWHRHRGVVGYDKGRVLDMFEKAGHDEPKPK
jgi:hypothetical protein